MKVTGKKEPFLDFLRELVIDMFTTHGRPPQFKKRPSVVSPLTRWDGLNHWICGTELDHGGRAKRRNCKQCTNEGRKDNKTVFMCEKCSVPLHTNCFKDRIHCIYYLTISLGTFIFYNFIPLLSISMQNLSSNV